MATYTTNFNLYKPDATDDFKDFRAEHNNNMDIIDLNLGSGGGVHDVLVNGVSVVDGNMDAQIVSYKEVTQAEYDLLPSSKLTDGIAYFIKDGNPSVGGTNAVLLWEGSHSGAGTIQVPGLSAYLVIAVQNDVSVLMFGNKFTGVGALGQYNANSAFQFDYRFNTSVDDELTIDANNRGIIRNGNNLSTYGSGEWCTITKIYGLFRLPV